MPVLTTREKLIQAGHEIFYREGFLLVGLDRLLAEVGCSKQTFYNHFESKDDLIAGGLSPGSVSGFGVDD